jgi:glycosyltransferase involved in cell wall biosynthesis
VVLVLGATVLGQPQSGVQARRHHAILAMTDFDVVSIVVLYPTPESACREMKEAYGVPVVAPPADLLVTSPARRLFMLMADPRREPSLCWRRHALRQWLEPRLAGADVAFVEAGYDQIASALPVPAVVDLDDLVVQQAKQRIAAIQDTLHHGGATSWRRWPARVALWLRLVAELERQRRWRSVQNRCMARAAVVLVCSDDDRLLLEAEQIRGRKAELVVVRNGYEPTRPPVGSDEPRHPATVAFVGHFGYQPNSEAIGWFVDQVWPTLFAARPGIRALVVGLRSDELGLERHEGVFATGRVDDPVDYLAQADVVVVPLRSGGGTRIKIIEAWAYGVPVVSTSIGAYGLGASDAVDLLIADTPEAFAEAVERLLDDVALRTSLRENGLRRASDLTWDRSRVEIARVIEATGQPVG